MQNMEQNKKITCTSILTQYTATRIAKFVTEEGMRKKIFLFAAGSLGKKNSPGRCAGNKAIFFFGLKDPKKT